MLCFLLGSTDRSILVHKVVEFIEFDHEVQDLIRVVADFYLENRASEDSCLLAIHAGDPQLRDASSDWLNEGDFEGRVARKVFGSFYADFRVGGMPGTRTVTLESTVWKGSENPAGELIFAVDPAVKMVPIDVDSDSEHPPLVCLETVIPSKKKVLVRVRGEFRKDSIERLIGEDAAQVTVFGEMRLVDRIRKRISSIEDERRRESFGTFFDDFCDNFWVSAGPYHFFLEVGNRQVRPVSADLYTGFEEQEFERRSLSWYWTTPQHFGLDRPIAHDRGSLLTIDRYSEATWMRQPVSALVT